jgi:hypothetical protein
MGGETKRNMRQRNDRDDRKFLHCSSAIQVYIQMFTYQFNASRTEKGTHQKQKRESKSNPNETEQKKRNPKIRFYFPEKNKNKIEGICEGSHTTEDRIWKLELSMKNRRLASDRLVIG